MVPRRLLPPDSHASTLTSTSIDDPDTRREAGLDFPYKRFRVKRAAKRVNVKERHIFFTRGEAPDQMCCLLAGQLNCCIPHVGEVNNMHPESSTVLYCTVRLQVQYYWASADSESVRCAS
jgi:hypothetical protein